MFDAKLNGSRIAHFTIKCGVCKFKQFIVKQLSVSLQWNKDISCKIQIKNYRINLAAFSMKAIKYHLEFECMFNLFSSLLALKQQSQHCVVKLLFYFGSFSTRQLSTICNKNEKSVQHKLEQILKIHCLPPSILPTGFQRIGHKTRTKPNIHKNCIYAQEQIQSSWLTSGLLLVLLTYIIISYLHKNVANKVPDAYNSVFLLLTEQATKS